MSVRFEVAADPAPVTVAIATHNRAHLIGDALKSCLDQTVRPERVIVVDDGSSDDTASIVRSFTSLDIAYVNAGKIGLGNARNLATALCRSKYLCILDDDDIMLPNRIRDHMASFAEGAQMSHGGWINVTARGDLEFKPGKIVDEDVIVYAGGAITHGACCYLTALLREFPYRDDLASGIDFDLAMRLVRCGLTCAHTGSYLLLRRYHDSNLSLTHGEGQRSLRQVVVGMIDRTRSDAEIARRRQAASARRELVATPVPPFAEIYRLLGGLQGARRVVVSVPRQASEFFALMGRLGLETVQLELFDGQADLTSTVLLGCRPSHGLDGLEAFCAAVQRCNVLPAVTCAAAVPRAVQRPLAVSTPDGHFRLALKSFVLQELQLTHRLLEQQRPWTWYIAVREETVGGRRRPAYWLVSAPFRARTVPARQRAYVGELKAFIYGQTDLFAVTLGGLKG